MNLTECTVGKIEDSEKSASESEERKVPSSVKQMVLH